MARARKQKCPQCRKAFSTRGSSDTPGYPFCSPKCKLLDLGRWLGDEFAIVEDLSRGQDLAAGFDPMSIEDPDVRAALDELKES
jgi:endogenous inhibitor of DNA gyrase (YacG/DUF329 family)